MPVRLRCVAFALIRQERFAAKRLEPQKGPKME